MQKSFKLFSLNVLRYSFGFRKDFIHSLFRELPFFRNDFTVDINKCINWWQFLSCLYKSENLIESFVVICLRIMCIQTYIYVFIMYADYGNFACFTFTSRASVKNACKVMKNRKCNRRKRNWMVYTRKNNTKKENWNIKRNKLAI